MIDCTNKEIEIILSDIVYDSACTTHGKTYLYIIDTSVLNKILDEVRVKEGETPLFFPINNSKLNLNDWYEFRIVVDHARNCADTIIGWVQGAEEGDEYEIKIKDALEQVLEQLSEYGLTLKTVQEIG